MLKYAKYITGLVESNRNLENVKLRRERSVEG